MTKEELVQAIVEALTLASAQVIEKYKVELLELDEKRRARDEGYQEKKRQAALDHEAELEEKRKQNARDARTKELRDRYENPPVVKCAQCHGRGRSGGGFYEEKCSLCDGYGYLESRYGR